MGAWGPGIFSDDTASDIRGDYRELLEDQVPDVEAMRRVMEVYQHLDPDEQHVLWLALAATQSQLGRLDDQVRARALDVIDNGLGLELWPEAGAKELAKRKAALAELREQLVGPQPAPKAVRRPWRHETDLRPGDILSFSASNGSMALLRVLRTDDQRVGAAPILEWLDWTGRSIPAGWRLRRLKTRAGSVPAPGGGRRPATYRVARHRKKDQDWQDSGFVVAAHLSPRPDDAKARAWTYLEWRGLAGELERLLTTPWSMTRFAEDHATYGMRTSGRTDQECRIRSSRGATAARAKPALASWHNSSHSVTSGRSARPDRTAVAVGCVTRGGMTHLSADADVLGASRPLAGRSI